MKTLLALIAAILLSSCAALDSIGTDTSRTDAVQAAFVIESMPYNQLAEKCARWPRAVACTTETGVYLQGQPRRTYITIEVQYLNWADLGDKCGRFTGNGSCYEAGTLYTSSRYVDDYRLGGIGDLLDEAFNLGLGFNHRAHLGHEVMVHVLGNGADLQY